MALPLTISRWLLAIDTFSDAGEDEASGAALATFHHGEQLALAGRGRLFAQT
jgi:hypothetical protein